MPEVSSSKLSIRDERPEDRPAVQRLLQEAFQGPVEAKLVDLLREADKAVIALVATLAGQVAGHILFSPVDI